MANAASALKDNIIERRSGRCGAAENDLLPDEWVFALRGFNSDE